MVTRQYFSCVQVVEMCWSQQLYDAMIHVYNYGLHDYTTPLLELLLQLRGNLKKAKSISGKTSQSQLPDSQWCSPLDCHADVYLSIGNKLLVYIRSVVVLN